ncbi:MAG: HEAT repeat domain-containing protein, partial [candidate division Zixibacteria bacterium]|nr:HEAT repeat domain-containing protein [candidate division Zixibacteria bacterium]
AVPYLRKSLLLDDYRQVSRVCYVLGEIKDSSAVTDMINISSHARWQIRSSCAGALGKIGDKLADEAITILLSDSVETVRKSAAVAAGKLLVETAIEKLVHMLGDGFYGPRMCAAEALVKIGHNSIKPIIDSLDSGNIMVGDLGCSTLGNIGGNLAAIGVGLQLKSEDPARRVLAVKAVLRSNSSLACGLVELLKETETDPVVLFYINKTIDKYASR